jgi:two-component system, LytTR family, sensor kinase
MVVWREAPHRRRVTLRRLRSALLLFSAWLVFYEIQAAMGIAFAPKNGFSRSGWIEIDASIALLWTVLSAIIAVWHLRARRLSADLWTLIALHLPLLLAAAWVDAALARWMLPILNPAARMGPMWNLISSYADFDLVSYAAVVAVVEALIVRRALAGRQRQTMRLEHSLTRARLDYLEAQLQPHFLFNSLGAVSELAFDAPATASLVLQQLSAVFRTALAQRADEVTLGEELIALEPYLDIQRVRFADWLTIEYDIGDSAVDCLVPRFILQPLVENAIRHGLAGRSAAGTIRIRAAVENGDLVLRVSDDGVGLARAARPGHGIGLANVRERLSILYGDDRLRLFDGPSGGGVTAEVRVPRARRNPATAGGADSHQEPETGAPASPRIPRILTRPAARLALVWSVCAGIWIQQSYIYLLVRHRLDQTTWRSLVGFDLTNALLWALLTPLVLRGVRRFPVRRPRAWLRVLALAAAGFVVTVVHIELLRLLTRQSAPLWSSTFLSNLIVDLGIFGVLVVIAHRAVLAEWLREREADTSALEHELALASDRSAELRRIPPILLQSLDGIAAKVRHDPAATERQLARLADYLRVALECADPQGVTHDRRRRLDAAAVALRDSGAYAPELTRTA